MKKYAQLFNGEVVDIKEAESIAQLARAFGPEKYWVDVTNLDCKVGYVSKFVDGAGCVYVDPLQKPFATTPENIEEAVKIKKLQFGKQFAKERDKTRFIEFSKAKYDNSGKLIEPPVTYGFDCTPNDIVYFMAAFLPLMVNKSGTANYRVWLTTEKKGLVTFTYEEMEKIYNDIRYSQLQACAKYDAKKAQLLRATTVDEAMAIEWEDDNDNE